MKQNPRLYYTIKTIAVFLFLSFTVLSNEASAQKSGKIEYSGFFDSYYYRGPWNYTLSGGLSGYNGDLCGGLDCQALSYNFGIGANYKVWPRMYVGAEFNYFTLGATDAVKTRNISFTSTNFELIAYARLYLIDDMIRVAADRRRAAKKIKPYITLGFGGLMYTPVSTYTAMPFDSIIRTEGMSYPGITAVIPAGLGIQFVISPKVSFITEATYRLTLTDYLDDVGVIRGNSAGLPDSYGFLNIKLQITPSAPVRKKKRSLSVPENNGTGGGASSGEASPSTDGTSESTPATDTNTEEKAEGGTTEEAPAEQTIEELK